METLEGGSAIPEVDNRSGHLHGWAHLGLKDRASLLTQAVTFSSLGARQLSGVQSTAGTRAEPFQAAQPYLSPVNT